MSTIAEWLPRFIVEHRERHPKADLPDPDNPDSATFYEAWRTSLLKRGIQDYAIATEASQELVGEKIDYPRNHFPTLLHLATLIYKSRAPAEETRGPQPIEVARLQSKDCPRCEGQGYTVVWREHPTYGWIHAAAYCTCSLGNAIERLTREKHPDNLMTSQREIDAGRSAWKSDPEDSVLRSPAPAPGDPILTRANYAEPPAF